MRRPQRLAALGALGVVFGDIGTSPLYAMQSVFSSQRGAIGTTAGDVYGVVSLVFWAITIVVSVKYVSFIMRADNDGEGGIMALTALVQNAKPAKVTAALVALGVLGASLFYGDALVTPAISVLSAVEGLRVGAPGLAPLVLPITLVVLAALFAIQHYGTGLVGRLFGPVMAVWFAVLGLVGVAELARHPEVAKGLSPTYAVDFALAHGWVAFLALGSVVLAVTGAEALYADMGHFGRRPIRRAWFLLVFPALTLNYLAQASLILRSPGTIGNPFYLLVPGWAQLPMVVLATVATVIASQAVISGAFSVTRQAIQLGFLPRLTIRHTSASAERQVYVPAINWMMFAAVVALVVGFGSSTALASAYGVAVTGTFVVNTILFLAVARLRWHARRRMIVLGAALFLSVELTFLAATLTKVVHGGWLPLLVGISAFTVMMTWRRGQQTVTERRNATNAPLGEFVRGLQKLRPRLQRVPGTAVFLHASRRNTPLALGANVEHNHVLHQRVVTLSVEIARVPHVADEDRLSVDHFGHRHDGVTQLVARFGFQDHPDVPAALRLAAARGLLEREVDVPAVSYFVSNLTLVRTDAPGLSPLRKRLFLALAHNAASSVAHFRLPVERTVIMGSEIEL